jgi:hypothetical protein
VFAERGQRVFLKRVKRAQEHRDLEFQKIDEKVRNFARNRLVQLLERYLNAFRSYRRKHGFFSDFFIFRNSFKDASPEKREFRESIRKWWSFSNSP